MPQPDAPEPYPWPDRRRPDGILPPDRCLQSYLHQPRRDAINAVVILQLVEQYDGDPEKRDRYRAEAMAFTRHILRQLADVFPGTCE